MTLLCIETSTTVCSAALCKEGTPLKQCICYEGSNHARLLPLYVEELLAYAREQQMTIDAVALSEGPGSYTGLRIGTSTAKGICYGLNIPLIPVPTLEVLSEAVKEKSPITNDQSPIFIPMIDARRMEVYTNIMTNGEWMNGERAKAVVVEDESSLYDGDETVYYFGDGAEKCSTVFTKSNWHYIPGIVPEAQYVGILAEQIVNCKSSNRQSIDLAYYEPFYLKEFIAAPSHIEGLK
jgi:tRNA threonylcarbamoyladenosine biosynthesis protein TsaB